jgi:hypothetical protein
MSQAELRDESGATVDQGIPYSGIVVNVNFEKNTAAVWKNRRI